MRPIYLISLTPYPGVIHIPSIIINFLNPVIDFSKYHGVIVTSKQALKALENYSQNWENLVCLAISDETAKKAKEFGFKEVRTAQGDGTSVLNFLMSTNNGLRWIYARPINVATSWAEDARKSGFSIDEAIVYESVCSNENMEVDPYGILIFTSPSSVHCFIKHSPILSTHAVIVIGETTKKALPEGIVASVSNKASIQECVQIAKEIAREI